MQAPNRKAAFGIARLFAMLTAIIFLPVWTFNYWQGWVCLLAFFGPCIAITVYVAKNDPALLERRLKTGASAETVPAQKIIQVVQTFAAVLFVAIFVVFRHSIIGSDGLQFRSGLLFSQTFSSW